MKKRNLLAVLLFGGAALLALAGCDSPAASYDIVIRGGTVVDGSGTTPFEADIGIRAGRIAKIGEIEGAGEREIDARGRHVSPGWIDIMDQSGPVLPENGLAENKLLMGGDLRHWRGGRLSGARDGDSRLF